MKKYLSIMAMFSGVSFCVHATGILNPSNFVASVVSITRDFDTNTILGSRYVGVFCGTAWFYNSNRFLVTVAHFSDDAHISATNWTDVTLMQEAANGWFVERKELIPVRLFATLTTSVGESLSVLELQRSFTNAQILHVRSARLQNDTPVTCLGYPNESLRFAEGMFRGVSSDAFNGTPAGSYLYELFNEENRKIMCYGASGSPILDQHGEVVGVLDQMLYQDVSFAGAKIRTSTAWGQPNYAAIPIDALKPPGTYDQGPLTIKF